MTEIKEIEIHSIVPGVCYRANFEGLGYAVIELQTNQTYSVIFYDDDKHIICAHGGIRKLSEAADLLIKEAISIFGIGVNIH